MALYSLGTRPTFFRGPLCFMDRRRSWEMRLGTRLPTGCLPEDVGICCLPLAQPVSYGLPGLLVDLSAWGTALLWSISTISLHSGGADGLRPDNKVFFIGAFSEFGMSSVLCAGARILQLFPTVLFIRSVLLHSLSISIAPCHL